MSEMIERVARAHHIIYDGKDIENRDWKTHYRGPVLIHAGISKSEFAGWVHAVDNKYQFGGIIGYAGIVDCVEKSSSSWFNGKYGFVLANARPLPFIPCKGKLSFFTPDISAADRAMIDAALEETK
jgi:hypothetical protein